jgi:phosphatidylserine decarboxylase
MNAHNAHQYIERDSGRIVTERLLADSLVQLLYGAAREKAFPLFQLLTSARASRWMARLHFDLSGLRDPRRLRRLVAELDIDLSECVAPPEDLNSSRKLFERQIRYWERRPMSPAVDAVVSPADARVLVASLAETSLLFIKEKFFDWRELLGTDRPWQAAFEGGCFALLRLTPEKYHYNHAPVAGVVRDVYELQGAYHSCNPGAVVREVRPYSKNRRVVTVVDTNVPGGTGVGLVAMVEVVALMIGDICQCYSATAYDRPQVVLPGLFLRKGQPKSLYRPGSSVDVLFFQPGRVRFADDLVGNRFRPGVKSRFSFGFQQPLVETDIRVRSTIAYRTEESTS